MNALQLHTTVIQGDQPVASVHFAPADPAGYPWYPVHAWLHRSGLYPLLTPGSRSLIDVLLWQLWEQEQAPGFTPGLVIATIDQFAAWCGCSTRSAFRDVGFLLEPPAPVVAITGDPARLLAKRGPTVWEPMPGRSFARRKGKADTPLPAVAQTCQQTCAPDRPPLRARPTNQPNPEPERLVRPEGAKADSSAGAVVGWPGLNLFGQRAFNAGDVKALLLYLQVWHYAAEPLAACPHITVERVMQEAAALSMDKSCGNRPLWLAMRLARAFGVELPVSPKRRQVMADGAASGLEGIARLRLERMRSRSTTARRDVP